jgi:tetratricopeptide (TPR) repeat protein
MVFSLLALFAFQPDEAALRRIFEEGLARRRAEFGTHDRRTATAARDLGLFLARAGDRPAAAIALNEAVRIDQEADGPQSETTLSDTLQLALLLTPQEAEPLLQTVLSGANDALASRASDRLGSIRESARDPGAAAAFYRRALAREEKASGADSATVALRLNSLALVLDPPAAIPLLQRAASINRRVFGPRHPETASTLANLCGLLLAAGRVSESIQVGTTALSSFQAALGDHPRTAAAASNLADAYRAAGNRLEAERLYRRALAIDASALGPGDPEVQADARNLAEFLREIQRVREAVQVESTYGIQPARP